MAESVVKVLAEIIEIELELLDSLLVGADNSCNLVEVFELTVDIAHHCVHISLQSVGIGRTKRIKRGRY